MWVFSANYWSGNAEKANPRYYYPGHQYVDMLGCDVYTNYGHSFSKSCHDSLRAVGGGKPIAITENGTMPTNFSAWRTEQPYWVYWLTWWGFEGAGMGNTDALYTEVYSDPSVITQDKITPADTNLKIIRVSTQGAGTVTKNPNTSTYLKGTSVSLTVTPASGWEFTGWSGTVSSANNPLQVTVNTDYDLTATFKPLSGTIVNLVKNGDFSESATTGWSQLAAYEGAAATGQIVNGEYVVNITNGGSEAWHVQLTQNDIKLEQGKTYTFSFAARASATKEIFVKVGQNGGTYLQYAGKTLEVTTTLAVTSITFTMTDATDSGARIEFNIGKSTTTLYLDNVSLHEGTESTPVVMNRSVISRNSGLVLKLSPAGLYYNYESANVNANQISLYRIDGAQVITFYKNSGVIDRKFLTPGLYFVRAQNEKASFNRKVTIY